MDDEERQRVFDNYVEPEVTVEFLFFEKGQGNGDVRDEKPAFLYGFINLFLEDGVMRDCAASLEEKLLETLDFSVKEYDGFAHRAVDLSDYKFAVVRDVSAIAASDTLDESLFQELVSTTANLLVVGREVDVDRFKYHPVFTDWLLQYANTA